MTEESPSGPRRGTNDLLIEMCRDIADAYADIVKRRRRSHPKPSPDLVMDTRDVLQSALALLRVFSSQEALGLEDMLAELAAALGELDRGRAVPLLHPSSKRTKLSNAEWKLRIHAALAAEFGQRAHAASGIGPQDASRMARDEVARHITTTSGFRITAEQVGNFQNRLNESRQDSDSAAQSAAEFKAAVYHAEESARELAAAVDGTRDKKLRQALGAELAAYWRRQQGGQLLIATASFLRVKAG